MFLAKRVGVQPGAEVEQHAAPEVEQSVHPVQQQGELGELRRGPETAEVELPAVQEVIVVTFIISYLYHDG